MKKTFFAVLAIVLFSSHTMFLKLDSYFLEPNTPVSLQLFNGTFDNSENVIDRNRMLDASILSNGMRTRVTDSQWTEKDSITILNFQTGEAGTYVAGVSTKARSLEMSADDFNDYLEHEGIYDMLEWRKNNNALEAKAVEKYSKHVKSIFQVGDTKTHDWQTALGYPIEFIPLNNPYALHTGDSLEVKLLFKGKPLANQLVYADYKGSKNAHSHDGGTSHSHEVDGNKQLHTHTSGQKLRTDAEGIAKANLSSDGIWYFQTINLVNTEEEEEDGLTHESNWATLTFQVTHSHGEDTHTHKNEHGHNTDYKIYIFLIGSFLLIGILFLWFNRKSNTRES
ncbi:DUF4198 domain-containing protein [Croceitalea sp. MTPC9]|uniref:DUF4198 domain-containing protein n=1 Tax=unclassified Croceitalea TaxID=2632280 RepID=UPI002B3DD3ED|nr:DUF4198 domain-containing protein [Croceitalea sp. MTPC6]GMN17123.1 DUF4198 domain-containing protein [Croceitalea sp. MTPC9]